MCNDANRFRLRAPLLHPLQSVCRISRRGEQVQAAHWYSRYVQVVLRRRLGIPEPLVWLRGRSSTVILQVAGGSRTDEAPTEWNATFLRQCATQVRAPKRKEAGRSAACLPLLERSGESALGLQFATVPLEAPLNEIEIRYHSIDVMRRSYCPDRFFREPSSTCAAVGCACLLIHSYALFPLVNARPV